jgi:hypothetical protein
MQCHEAKNKLNRFGWCLDKCQHDSELLEHVNNCPECFSLIQAERALQNDISVLQKAEVPLPELTMAEVRERTKKQTYPSIKNKFNFRLFPLLSRNVLLPHPRLSAITGVVIITLGIMSFVPFTFKEKVGYEIAIAGVDKQVAMDNQKINSLLNALGMEKNKASSLLDSLQISEIRLTVGDCRETCQLRISDVKTEKEVILLQKAILDLGCCQIDNVIPIFKNESMSLLRHAVKLISS